MSVEPTAPARRSDIPNGLWALILLFCTEGAFLAAMAASYFYLRFTSTAWPPPGIAAPSVALPLVLTAALVITTVPVHLAVRAARAGRVRAVLALVALATVAQSAYLAVQVVDFIDELGTFSVTGTAYGSIYFTMLATDHAHVAIGLLANLWLLASVRRGLTAYRLTAVRAVAWYWSFVAAISVMFVLAQVSPS
jgi:heme/copper-type cytochrome/quinol oxidase subunit 3